MSFYLVDIYKNNILPVALQIAFLERLTDRQSVSFPVPIKQFWKMPQGCYWACCRNHEKLFFKARLVYLYGVNL